jgi:acyl-coenzyme A synthetase/AMP-(fatty) acid ligase
LENVRKHPDKLAIQEVQTERQVTFKELNALGNKFANYFQRLGYKKDDVVALFMENSIEFVACWIGLSKLVGI